MILAILLGPHAAFLVMASVLTIQALFFADGGLLALGCNIWNLGFYPCYLVYPFLYKPLAGKSQRPGRIAAASIAGAVAALQIGALSVVLETLLSGKSELPFGAFLLLMQPIHLAIGVVEGLVTAGVIVYVRGARPELIESITASKPLGPGIPLKKIMVTFGVLAILTGGVLSWFASTHPDGLEWAIENATGGDPLPEATDGVAALLRGIQGKTAFLPDYNIRPSETAPGAGEEAASWPGVDPGTSTAGIVGGAVVLGLVGLVGATIRLARKRERSR